MLDSHCHIDRYADPMVTARMAAERGVFTISVTNLPSHFRLGLPHVRTLDRVRLAVGLHPLTAAEHASELPLFEELLSETSFVGEVGLDFSREGRSTKDAQLKSFRFVAEHVSKTPKFLSLHSRGAEKEVLTILAEHQIHGAVFHWYSGSRALLEEVLGAGHYLSVNPSMTTSKNGRGIIAALPPDRVLTESDGPYAKLYGVPTNPWDVSVVEEHLSEVWEKSRTDVSSTVWENFRRIIEPLLTSPP
jgi:TatD DNase family protein